MEYQGSAIHPTSIDKPFEVVEGLLGPQLRIYTEWTSEIELKVNSLEFKEIGFQFWPQESIGFLSRFRHILGLGLSVRNTDPSPIMCLNNLRWLNLTNFSRVGIDFSSFMHLESCNVHWNASVGSLLWLKTLKELCVYRFAKEKLSRLGGMEGLTTLKMFGCGASSLDALRDLRSLEFLRISQLSRLKDNEFLRDMKNLRSLIVQECTGFHSLTSLSSLEHLEELVLEDVGRIHSLKPLEGLTKLKSVVLMGNRTCIEESDHLLLSKLPRLERLVIRFCDGVVFEAS